MNEFWLQAICKRLPLDARIAPQDLLRRSLYPTPLRAPDTSRLQWQQRHALPVFACCCLC